MTFFKCKYPYSNLTIDPTGQLKPCCRFLIPNKFYKEKNTQNYINYFLTSNLFEEIRSSFDKGEFHDGCKKCHLEEISGKESFGRRYSNIEPITDTKSLQTLDIAITRTCNMKCIICGPHASTKWNEDAQSTEKYITPNLESIANIIHQQDIRFLKITGGEPLLSHNFLKLLKSIKSEKSTSITIQLNTNGTIWNNAIVKELKRFKKTNLQISVDSTKENADYSRFGQSWSIIKENINKFFLIDDMNIETKLFCTISILNFHKLNHVAELNKPTTFNLLIRPSKLSVFNIPREIRTNILKDYNFLTKELENQILSKDTNLIDELKCYLEELDKLRNTNYKDHLPKEYFI